MGKYTKEFEKIFNQNADRIFLTDSTIAEGADITYGQLYSLSVMLKDLFIKEGVKKGDRVAILLNNGYEIAAGFFASILAGAITVPINPVYHKNDIAYILKEAETSLLLTSSDFTGLLEEINPDNSFKTCILKDRRGLLGKLSKKPKEKITFPEISDEDIMVVSYTSGTTAHPKGVVVNYGPMIKNASEFINRLEFDKNSVFYCPLSLSYMAGWYNLLFLPFLAQARVVIDSVFSAKSLFTFWDTVIKYKVNVLWLVPTILSILLSSKNSKAREYCKANVKRGLVGTAPLPASLKKAFEKEFNLFFFENYGLTETFFITTNAPEILFKEGSVGKPLEGCKIIIKSPSGSVCKPLEEGEIFVKTEYLTPGYYSKNGITAVKKEDGCFVTGDVGKVDESGYLFITGRKKDLIIKGGVNISPRAIEEVLHRYEPVMEAAVIGMESESYGEDVIAVIRLKDQFKKTYDESRLVEFCEKNLSKIQKPRKFIIIDEMPKSSSGKIQKEKLKTLIGSINSQILK